MRIVLLGGGGMLGRELRASAPPGVHLVTPDRATLDITDATAVESLLASASPDAVINAAAYTDVDRAEIERERAWSVNADAPGLLGRAARRQGAKVVHFSTDYVFDGHATLPYAEDAEAHPVNHYGRSKLEGERTLRESGARHLIVRTQWLFDQGTRHFPALMAARARAGERTRVVQDQFGAPTSTLDVAAAVWRLLGHEGTLHVASTGSASRFEIAQRVFARFGEAHLVSPCLASQFPAGAKRPRFTALDSTKARALGASLPAWTDALDRWLGSPS